MRNGYGICHVLIKIKNLMYAHPLYFLQKNKLDISVNSIERVYKYCKLFYLSISIKQLRFCCFIFELILIQYYKKIQNGLILFKTVMTME